MNLSTNPAYKVAFHSEVHNIDLYIPVDPADGYHASRYMAGAAQDIFSESGATKQLTGLFYAQIKKLCTESMTKKDFNGFMHINTLMDNLLYRHQYPVDEDCLIRMGAIYCFLEDEDPNKVQDFYTQKKVQLAKGNMPEIAADPELYTFFLSMGHAFTPSYADSSEVSIDSEYFQTRNTMLQTLYPR